MLTFMVALRVAVAALALVANYRLMYDSYISYMDNNNEIYNCSIIVSLITSSL